MRKGSIAFANFICTFGDAGGLLDNWDIVGPAFLTDTLIRRYGVNHFHLYDVEIVQFPDENGVPVVAVCGRFVKNIRLTREQTFDQNGNLVKDAAYMPSSPSAYFVLVLNTHRLVYYAETAHAPDLKSFEATMANFVKRFRQKKISEQYESADRKITKKALQDRLPRPTLTIVPLSERDRLSDFIDRFAKIEVVKFRLVKPNHESDASKIVSAVRERFGPLQPDHLDIIASSSGGLDRPEVKLAVEEASETGNTDITIRGVDVDGSKLRGSADKFALTIDLQHPESTDSGLRAQLYNQYRNLVSTGKIKLGEGLDHASSAIRSIAAFL